MITILDYILLNSDKIFDRMPFNEIDSSILCLISYLPWDGIIEKPMLLFEAINEYQKTPHKDYTNIDRIINDNKLIELVKNSKRYKNIKVSDYVNKIDELEEKQFSALLFELEEDYYIAYRGTDDTIIGWKEDFNMSFISPIPSQQEASRYFINIANKYQGMFYLGGHSKGGNLAVFAASTVHPTLEDRIIRVYNYDGPGFPIDFFQQSNYFNVNRLVRTMVPQSSVIGMLLNHDEYNVVYSKQIGLLQHDLYFWIIRDNQFVKLEQVSNSSKFITKTVCDLLSTLSVDERKQLIDTIYHIITVTGVKTVNELNMAWISSAQNLLLFGNLDENVKKVILEIILSLFRISKYNLLSFIQN